MSQAEIVVEQLLNEIKRLNKELAVSQANSFLYQQELKKLLEKENKDG